MWDFPLVTPCLETLKLRSISDAALGMLSFHLESGVWLAARGFGFHPQHIHLLQKSCVLFRESVLILLHGVGVSRFPDSDLDYLHTSVALP